MRLGCATSGTTTPHRQRAPQSLGSRDKQKTEKENKRDKQRTRTDKKGAESPDDEEDALDKAAPPSYYYGFDQEHKRAWRSRTDARGDKARRYHSQSVARPIAAEMKT